MAGWWRWPGRRACAARIGLLAAVLAVGALVGGCSAGGTDPEGTRPGLPRYYDISELVAAVAARQRAEQTARFSLRGELVGTGADARTLRFTGQGVLRVMADQVSVKFTQVVSRSDAPPQETGFILLPDAVYLRMPPGAEAVPDKPWVRVDPDSDDPEDRQLVAFADTLAASADPTRNLARYADASLIADAADDTIDGEPAARYTIVVDLARAAELEADPAVREQLEQQVRSGLARVTSTLWVDAADRPVRSAVRQQLPGVGVLAITGSYREWGQPVEIAAPPAAQIRP